MREAFEAAIRENPDERANYSAYADWLQEQDDPRGEFIAVQLALEDESRSKDERDALKEREKELLAAHEREWLGELAAYLPDDRSHWTPFHWRWGCLASVRGLSISLAQALATAPAARFLRELQISGMGQCEEESTPYRAPLPDGVTDHDPLFELIGSPCLHNLQVFRIGEDELPEDDWTECYSWAWGIHHVIATMPRIEELHLLCKGYKLRPLFTLPNLTNLRVLRVFHLGGRGHDDSYAYPLDVLAANPAARNLTDLRFHPHVGEGFGLDDSRSYLPLPQVRALVNSPHLKKLTHLQLRLSDMGDDGIREIIASGILKQLRWLDLRHGCVTDEGARLLAACQDAKQLERIDLSRNGVTASGLAVLRAAGVNAVANEPLTQQELNDQEYLNEGAFE